MRVISTPRDGERGEFACLWLGFCSFLHSSNPYLTPVILLPDTDGRAKNTHARRSPYVIG